MNILVTGGAGFIGSHIVDRLIVEGHNVAIIDNLCTGREENINTQAAFYKKDIRDKDIDKIFEKEKFNILFHLAAQMDVRTSVQNPFFDADVNIMGGINLLEACVKHGVKRFVFASSGGVMYGECGSKMPAETQYPDPLCPYGASKLALEFYLNFYRDNHGLQTVALRFGNVYGPRQDPHGEAGVVAIFCGAMLKNKKIMIFGNGNQLRDYIYVEDIVSANIKAMTTGSGVYNIGTGTSESVNELFDILKEEINFGQEPVYKQKRAGELEVSRMNISKANQELGWGPQYNFKEGLKRTIEYFRKQD
ncbi:NAD-dependent epimerase/dehydratase family protein [Elusimicrobiota bacterium]